jgi:transposase
VRTGSEHQARLERLESELPALVQTWRWRPGVEALQALRGVPCTAAVILSADLGALTRVAKPRHLMRSLGLRPSEHPTGEHRRQGGLTKTGTAHARRALLEGAGAYRSPAQVSRHWHLRLETVSKASQDLSGQAPGRLGKRYRRLVARSPWR